MSQLSRSSNSLSKPSTPEIRLYERVRLQSFQGLLPGAQNRMRSSIRFPHVLLEDLLKAEVISLQLVLAIEDVVKLVKQDFGQSPNNNRGKMKVGCEQTDVTDDDGRFRHFQSALAQSANALDELTKLQISENESYAEEMEMSDRDTKTGTKPSNNCLQTPFFDGGISKQPSIFQNSNITKRLSYGSGTTTSLSEPSWNFSVRVSELSTTPSDAMADINDESLLTCGRKDDGLNIEEMVKDAMKTLRVEMEGLQIKHERQFVNYAAECLDLNQDENQNTREILKMIMENLSPQDENWAYQGKFDEHGMEQLFYFVLLQKTLKSCLAIIDTINMDEGEEVQPSKEMRQNNPESKLHPSYQSNQTLQCPSSHDVCQTDACQNYPASGFNHSFWSMNNTTCSAQENTCMSEAEFSENIKDHDGNLNKNCVAQMNGKRMNEFDDEREVKKQRKSLFACFSARWPKRRQKGTKKRE